MRPIVRSRVDSWLLLSTAVGLCGCPLLLDDRFAVVDPTEPDAGEACIGLGCDPRPGDDAGGRSGSDGSGAFGSGVASTGGTGSTGGTTSSSGTGGAGSVGTGGGGGTGGSSGTGAEEPCWTLELTPSTYGTSTNCIGVQGSTTVVVDSPSTLALSYEAGDPCFNGTIDPSGWGAIYELTFAGDDGGSSVWNASGAGVAGFEFAYRGTDPPTSMRVIYKDPSGVDNCYVTDGSRAIPFSMAHPDCDDTGATVDTTRLVELILAFVPRSQPYNLDFCVQIRAFD